MKPCVFLDVFLVCSSYCSILTSKHTEVCSSWGRSWTAPNGSPAQRWGESFPSWRRRGLTTLEYKMLFDLPGTARPREARGRPLLPPPVTPQSQGWLKLFWQAAGERTGRCQPVLSAGLEAWKRFLIVFVKRARVSKLWLMSRFGVRDVDGRAKQRQGEGSSVQERAGVLKNNVLFWGN